MYAATALGEFMKATSICSTNKMATCFPKAIIICSVQKLESVWIVDYMSTPKKCSSHTFMERNGCRIRKEQMIRSRTNSIPALEDCR